MACRFIRFKRYPSRVTPIAKSYNTIYGNS